jgi:hypothetical protein
MSETALAVMDDAFLAGMSDMVDPNESTGRQGPPTLKINYDPDSVHERGAWVLGQQKNKDQEITDEGVIVQRLIILTSRCRWSYYDDDSPENSFNTKYGMDAMSIPDKTEFFARANELGLEKGDDYKFQMILFGLAVYTDDAGETKMTECISRLQGSALPPLFDYMDLIKFAQTSSGKKVEVPRFAFFTKFGECEKRKHGSTVYFVPSFERGEGMPQNLWKFCYDKRQEAYDYIDTENETSRIVKDDAAAPAAAWTPPTTPPAAAMGDVPEWESPPAAAADPVANALPVTATEPVAPPAVAAEPAAAPAGMDDFDISSVVAAIKGGLPTS